MTLEQLSLLGPPATGLAATVALIVGVATVRQRTKADRRDQWWKRAQWALDLALCGNNSAVIGLSVLEHLAESDLAGPDEAEMLEAAWRLLLDSLAETGDDQPAQC